VSESPRPWRTVECTGCGAVYLEDAEGNEILGPHWIADFADAQVLNPEDADLIVKRVNEA